MSASAHSPAISSGLTPSSPQQTAFARLDGGFDGTLSRAFAPEGDYHALIRVSQAALLKEWRGFAPPGSLHAGCSRWPAVETCG
jgi:hypothetical protein